MAGNALLHLYLYGAVARIYIVKQFLARFAGVGLHLVVEVFGDVHQSAIARSALCRPQTKVIETGILIVGIHPGDNLLQYVGAPEHYAAEIEIVPQSAHLVINHGCFFGDDVFAFLYLLEMVGIDHLGTGHFQYLHHPFLCPIHPLYLGFEQDKRIGRGAALCYMAYLLGGADTAWESEGTDHCNLG